MSKEQIDSKVLAVRVPTQVFDKFKSQCSKEGFRMSEVIRLLVRDFSENGCLAVASIRDRLRFAVWQDDAETTEQKVKEMMPQKPQE